MRVAVVSMYTTDHREDQATARTRRVAETMAADGHEVTWLCSQWWDGHSATFERNDVVYRAVTQGPAAGSFRSKLPFSLRKVGAELIHAVNAPPSHAVTAKQVGRLLRTPAVVDWWPQSAEGSTVEKAARVPDAVITPSELVRTVVRELGADGDDVRVVPESIDFDLVRDSGVDQRADIVYVRELDEHANVGEFLLALAELRDREWRAAVIGDGPARETAERTARDLRIDDRVSFLGDLPPSEFVPILKGAHAVAQTAIEEPFATGLLWGLACGCVGIVEYQAGSSAHELVENRDRGRRVTDPQELADAIVECAELSRREINEGFAEFDHETVLNRYLDIYREVIDDHGLF